MNTLKDKIRRFIFARKDFNFRWPLSWLLNEIKKDHHLYRRVVMQFRNELIKTAETYPSLINKHDRHIQKAINLVHQFQLNLSNPVIDVGAGSGEFAVILAKALKQAKVYAFEPIKDNFEKIKKEAGTYSNIIPINKALGSHSGEAEINVAKGVGSSSIFPLNAGDKSKIYSESVELERTESIIVATLDDQFSSNEKINIIKLDVQGYELEVLRGGLNTLKNTSIVLCELSNHDYYKNGAKYFHVDDFLREHNFSLFNFYPGIVENEQVLEWDAIYVKKDLLKDNHISAC